MGTLFSVSSSYWVKNLKDRRFSVREEFTRTYSDIKHKKKKTDYKVACFLRPVETQSAVHSGCERVRESRTLASNRKAEHTTATFVGSSSGPFNFWVKVWICSLGIQVETAVMLAALTMLTANVGILKANGDRSLSHTQCSVTPGPNINN